MSVAEYERPKTALARLQGARAANLGGFLPTRLLVKRPGSSKPTPVGHHRSRSLVQEDGNGWTLRRLWCRAGLCLSAHWNGGPSSRPAAGAVFRSNLIRKIRERVTPPRVYMGFRVQPPKPSGRKGGPNSSQPAGAVSHSEAASVNRRAVSAGPKPRTEEAA